MSNENVLEALREINTKLGAIRSGLPNPIQYKTDPVVEVVLAVLFGALLGSLSAEERARAVSRLRDQDRDFAKNNRHELLPYPDTILRSIGAGRTHVPGRFCSPSRRQEEQLPLGSHDSFPWEHPNLAFATFQN